MLGISHLVVGASTSLAAMSLVAAEPRQYAIGLVIGSIASLAPDLDAENSMLQVWLTGGRKGSPVADNLVGYHARKRLPEGLIHAVLGIVERLICMVLWLAIDLVKQFTKHRGLTHSLFFLLFLMLIQSGFTIVFRWHPVYTIALTTGYLSHLFADATTKSGVQLLFPFSKLNMHITPKKWHYTMGTWPEYMVVVTIAGLSIMLLYLTKISTTITFDFLLFLSRSNTPFTTVWPS